MPVRCTAARKPVSSTGNMRRTLPCAQDQLRKIGSDLPAVNCDLYNFDDGWIAAAMIVALFERGRALRAYNPSTMRISRSTPPASAAKAS
jgi:hypothetical protein